MCLPCPCCCQQGDSPPRRVSPRPGRKWILRFKQASADTLFFVPPPEGGEGFLGGVDFVQGAAFEKFSVFHDVLNAICVVDVVERILVEHDQVGKFARFDGAEVRCEADRFSAMNGGGFEDLEIRNASGGKDHISQ